MADIDVYETIAEAIAAQETPKFQVPDDQVRTALAHALSFAATRQAFQQWLIMRVAALSGGRLQLEPIPASETPGPLDDAAADPGQVLYLRMDVSGEPFAPSLAVGPIEGAVQFFYRR
jgi:hypothetical protein